jgi:tetratricopeptide (TPR) repeat protein
VFRLPLVSLLLMMVLCFACKNEQQKEAIARDIEAVDALRQGRTALAKQRYAEAIDWFKKSLADHPDEVATYLLLAESYRRSGDSAVALLTLKQARGLLAQDDPSLSRAMIDLYLETKEPKHAIEELQKLSKADLLTEVELLQLTRLLAREGSTEEAFQVLNTIQKRAPDDVDAKVAEAEVLMAAANETLAGKLLDRLVQENPAVTSVRMARAKFFLSKGKPELSQEELENIATVDMRRGDVVALRVKSLNASGHADKSETLLTELVEIDAEDVQSQSLLASTLFVLQKYDEAKAMVDKVLTAHPQDGRSLVVRAQLERQRNRVAQATEAVAAALQMDPDFPEALALSAELDTEAGRTLPALEKLNRLVFLNEATQAQKLSLAQLLLEARTDAPRCKRIVEEILESDAKNKTALALKAKVDKLLAGKTKKARKQSGGIQIINGSMRR